MEQIKIPYEEPKLTQENQDMRIEHIQGFFPVVSSAPTWVPKNFLQSCAVYSNGATYRFYYYDYVNNAWRYLTGT